MASSSREKDIASIPVLRAVAGPQTPSTLVRDTVTIKEIPPSYVYGTPTGGNFQTIASDSELKPGDVVRFNYRLKIPFLQEWQSDYYVGKIARDSRYSLRYYALHEEQSRLVVEVEILQSGSPALVYAIAVAALAVGALVFITTDSIEKLSTVEIGDTKVKLTPLTTFAALGLGALFHLHRK
jgi:hypothetical protein